MKLNLSKDLEPSRNEKLAQIDADANRALESYRTSSGIAVAAYALKRDELSASDAGRPIEMLSMLQAEAKSTDTTPEELLETWRTKITAEDAAIIDIEARRQALKARAKAARNPAEIAAIVWA